MTHASAGDGQKPKIRQGILRRRAASKPLDGLGFWSFVLTVDGGHRVAELIVMQDDACGCESALDDELMQTTWAVAGRITRRGEETWSVPLESVL